MAVYVDDAGIPASVPNGAVTHTSEWSHLTADTRDELHEFAARLGLKRAYFQTGTERGDDSPSPFWHYDVTKGKRFQAIRLGAREVSWREMPEICIAREEGTPPVIQHDPNPALADAYAKEARMAMSRGALGNPAMAARLIRACAHLDPARAEKWTACQEWIRGKAEEMPLSIRQEVALAGEGMPAEHESDMEGAE